MKEVIQRKVWTLPIFCIRRDIIFPGTKREVEVGRLISKAAIDAAVDGYDGRIIVLCQKKATPKESVGAQDIYHFGVLARTTIQDKFSDETYRIELDSRTRVKVSNIRKAEGHNFLVGGAEVVKTKISTVIEAETKRQIRYQCEKFNKKAPERSYQIPEEFWNNELQSYSASELVDRLADFRRLKLTIERKQKVLEELDPRKRLNIIFGYLELNYGNEKLDREIRKKIQNKVDDQQKEFYLRERLRVIKEELDKLEGGNKESDRQKLQRFKKQLESDPFPKSVKARVNYEINRYETCPRGSNEAYLIFDYINWVMSIPWYERSKEVKDLKHAQKVLDSYHYGLIKPKQRIIEHLAVRQFQQQNRGKGQIICFVGPPGVGKTSLARSIAAATGRVFVKISLGGVKDEAEIRGHRRTYIGAMPGRVIKAMKRAKVTNPVFLLDEIDKIDASAFRGDPADALLEVLDPEQNAHFSDHYIDEDYNLQDVLFIATANYLENIPDPLMDRMEIITLSSYTEIEKLKIAMQYLIPDVLKSCNLTTKDLNFQKRAINEIVKHYTREAGVRELERCLESVMRKFLVKKLNGVLNHLNVNPEVVRDYLGKHKFEHNLKEKKPAVGAVSGLAYTSTGGEKLMVEVSCSQGQGKLKLTGKLGDVMRESAEVALAYVKSNATRYKITPEFFADHDVHIHVPEGAVPKDGPSAGITITTAIISALTEQAVSPSVCMTGEMTLRGNVLAIGGLKEKLIAANRSGLSEVIIPTKNKKDLDEVPTEVKNKLNIYFCDKYQQVYRRIFRPD